MSVCPSTCGSPPLGPIGLLHPFSGPSWSKKRHASASCDQSLRFSRAKRPQCPPPRRARSTRHRNGQPGSRSKTRSSVFRPETPPHFVCRSAHATHPGEFVLPTRIDSRPHEKDSQIQPVAATSPPAALLDVTCRGATNSNVLVKYEDSHPHVAPWAVRIVVG